MAETFILKKRQDFLFALEDHEDKVYHLPALKSLGFEEAKKLVAIDDEKDLIKKGESIRDFMNGMVPDLKDAGISDMEYLEIFNAYAMSEGREALGESKASPSSSKNTARQ